MKTLPPVPSVVAASSEASIIAEARTAGVYWDLVPIAWDLISRQTATWVAASTTSIAILGTTVFIQAYVSDTTAASPTLAAGLRAAWSAVAVPFVAYGLLVGMMHMGVRQAYGERIGCRDLFVGLRQMWQTALIATLSIVFVYAGSVMCIVPGIYMIGSLCLAGLHGVETGSRPLAAMVATYRKLKSSGLAMFGVIFVASLWSILGLVCFGIGIVLTLPIVAVVLALHYTYFFPRSANAALPHPSGDDTSST